MHDMPSPATKRVHRFVNTSLQCKLPLPLLNLFNSIMFNRVDLRTNSSIGLILRLLINERTFRKFKTKSVSVKED